MRKVLQFSNIRSPPIAETWFQSHRNHQVLFFHTLSQLMCCLCIALGTNTIHGKRKLFLIRISQALFLPFKIALLISAFWEWTLITDHCTSFDNTWCCSFLILALISLISAPALFRLIFNPWTVSSSTSETEVYGLAAFSLLSHPELPPELPPWQLCLSTFPCGANRVPPQLLPQRPGPSTPSMLHNLFRSGLPWSRIFFVTSKSSKKRKWVFYIDTNILRLQTFSILFQIFQYITK